MRKVGVHFDEGVIALGQSSLEAFSIGAPETALRCPPKYRNTAKFAGQAFYDVGRPIGTVIVYHQNVDPICLGTSDPAEYFVDSGGFVEGGQYQQSSHAVIRVQGATADHWHRSGAAPCGADTISPELKGKGPG